MFHFFRDVRNSVLLNILFRIDTYGNKPGLVFFEVCLWGDKPVEFVISENILCLKKCDFYFLLRLLKRKKNSSFLYPPLAYINQPLMGKSQKYISEIGIQSNTNELVFSVRVFMEYLYDQVKNVGVMLPNV